ncbi:MAG: hypothetical protein JNM03_17870 [Sphingopyxis sp.]|uniref:hypothetical protein n=1 Tax=Sphingopyxis sp. TaxID=1908224 RepID=UPI001A4678DE|nr:hypothetical protein [Sphingopyxis sp.]MBL9071854.1 hypothetical protein [Sphingopyxis sp.]
MVYRKGERPVPKVVRAYNEAHPVAKCIADGDLWLRAWMVQMCTPWPSIARKTGLSIERIAELDKGAEPTQSEVAKLAALWWVTPEDLSLSIAQAAGKR